MAAEYLERMGARIRDRREELGLSRSEVARQMPGKTTENQIYRWEKGLHRPNDDALEALASVLGVTIAHFLADAPVAAAQANGDRDDGLGPLVRYLAEQVERFTAQNDRLEERLRRLEGGKGKRGGAAE